MCLSPASAQTSGGSKGFVLADELRCWTLGKTNCWWFGSYLLNQDVLFHLVEPIAHTFWGLERTENPLALLQVPGPRAALTMPGCCVSEMMSYFHICFYPVQKAAPSCTLLTSCCQGPTFVELEVWYVFGRWYSALQLLRTHRFRALPNLKFKLSISTRC